MKKKRITYGVYGFMEYQSLIKVGPATMKVTFTDGSMNAMGTTPATFATNNLIVQRSIEFSRDFKRGLIKRVSVVELNQEEVLGRNPVKVENSEPKTESAVPEPKPEQSAPKAEDAVPVNSDIEEIAVTCLADARQLLQDRFGYEASKVRTTGQIMAAATAHNITFTGL